MESTLFHSVLMKWEKTKWSIIVTFSDIKKSLQSHFTDRAKKMICFCGSEKKQLWNNAIEILINAYFILLKKSLLQ